MVKSPVVDGRFAIAVFRGDIDLDWQPRPALDPIFGDEPRNIGGAAADDRHAREPRWIGGPGEGFQLERRHVDVTSEGVADHLRLLVDLLGHEMPVIAPFREQAAGRASLDAALDMAAGRIADVGALAGQRHPVAFLEIGDAVSERSQCERVRAQIHFRVAIADRKRRALARADQEILLALEQIDERERPAQPAERRLNRLLRRLAFFQFVLDDECGNLGIGLGRERIAFGGEFLPQRPEILDDPVVDDRKPRGSVRMGVGFGRLAMRRPAGVADADRPAERRCGELRLQVLELALGAPPLELAVLERRHAGGIIAAIFEPLQRIDNRAGDRSGPENPDNSTHKTALRLELWSWTRLGQ